MKIYRTGGFYELIEVVEATRVNDKSVWIFNDHRQKEERSNRYGNYHNFYDTIEEAKGYLESKYNKQIEHAEDRIKTANDKLKILRKY